MATPPTTSATSTIMIVRSVKNVFAVLEPSRLYFLLNIHAGERSASPADHSDGHFLLGLLLKVSQGAKLKASVVLRFLTVVMSHRPVSREDVRKRLHSRVLSRKCSAPGGASARYWERFNGAIDSSHIVRI